MRNSNYIFADLGEPSHEVRPSYYFMMRSLLHSRIDTGLTSNQDESDEDVNVYLAHLLHSFGDPQYLEQAIPFLSRYDHELFDRLEHSNDSLLKYRAYKTNADFLLASAGIFGNENQSLFAEHSTPLHKGRRRWDPTLDETLDRGRAYYGFAYTYSRQVNRSHPAVSDVLGKLSRGYNKYLRILSHLRSEYLELVQGLSQGEVYHLERTIQVQQDQAALLSAQDVFLDAYAAWKRSGSAPDRNALDRAAEKVKSLDPGFEFNEG